MSESPRKKKPRFSQQAHASKPNNVAKRTKKKTYSKTTDSSSSDNGNAAAAAAAPWRSRKSIEELEATMTNRWGTGLDRWTFDPNEYEIDDEGDNSSSIDKRPTVLDPWKSQQQQQGRNSRPSPVAFGSSTYLASADNNDDGDDDPLLHRVRRNQQRFQRPETQQQQQQNSREYYDEDDEGYESDNVVGAPSTSLYRIDHLISPRPVGGRGSNQIDDNDDPANEKPGFFFNNPLTTAVETSPLDEKAGADVSDNTMKGAKQGPQQRQQRRSSTPVLDDTGSPLYLTLEQARRDFEVLQASESDGGNTASSQSLAVPATRSWEELGITSPRLLENLKRMSCGSPLSVQNKACPSILTGNDVLIGTYTGSGKTLAFLVPLAQRLLFEQTKQDDLQVLIVAPGRELASQIASVARSLLEGTGLTVMLSIGGTTFARNLEQIRKRKPSILVGTPGRIAELVVGQPGEKSGRLKVGSLEAVVLDEFDALLEYRPHRDPTAAIMANLRKRHGDSLQSILCSATASNLIGSKKVESLLREGFVQAMADHDDKLVTSADATPATARVSRTVIHGVIHVPHRRLALETLRRILHTEPIPQQVLIFADDARRVDIVVEKLGKMGIIAAPLHGGFGSEKADRAEVSRGLREGYIGIVVATELAARGLDAPLLTHVINLDLPTDASHYAHRAGRCGRGGRPGVVVNLTKDPKERNVPHRIADSLGITMHTVEARSGKLAVIEPNSAVDGREES